MRESVARRRPLARTLAGLALAGAMCLPAGHAGAATRARATGALRPTPWLDAAIGLLGTRGDANSLATAALIGRSGDGALALANRAARLAPDDAAIGWLDLRVCAATAGCDTRGVAAAMRWLDPDNAAAWLPTLDSAVDTHDDVETDRVLVHMARGSSLDFYWNPIVARAFDALRAVAARIPGHALDSDAAVLAAVERAAGRLILPPLTALETVCRDSRPGNPQRPACEKIARLLRHGDTIDAQYAGYSIARRFARYGSPGYRALGEARRVLEWRVANAARFDAPLLPWLRSAHARWRVEQMRKLARQEDVILAVLRYQGLPIDPPPPPPAPTPPPAPPEPLHKRPP
ncbi:MAG: hypothetical protein KGL36_01505 [Gammaproteobacteria bacterium]|nr:hypothetical protein [Gammaproteobacteria bacterium]